MNVNKGFNYAFALNHQCMWMLGIWPDPRIPSSGFRRLNIRLIIISCILSFYVIIPQLTNMIRAWGNVARMVQHVAAVNFSLMALSKLVATWYHSETLRTLMASVMTDWINSTNNRERNTMLRLAKRGRSLSSKCYVFILFTILFYMSTHIPKLFRNIHPQRSLVYQFVYPYNTQKSPNYEITFILQLSGGIYSGLINCSVDSFVSILLLHICAQLINLRMALNKLVDELANKTISSLKFKESLAAVAIRHKHLIRNAKMIDNCYSAMLLVHMLTATFQLCFQVFRAYTMTTEKLNVSAFKMGFFSFSVVNGLLQLYIYCYSAERLLTESTNIAYSVYECNWYNISAKDAKTLMFIAYGSSIPLKLTAGKFGTFSIEMFGATIKAAMGYLSMLLTINKD